MSAAPDLLPCPFCGGRRPFIERMDFAVHRVICNDCGANGPAFERTYMRADERQLQEAGAARLWNKRKRPAPSTARGAA